MISHIVFCFLISLCSHISYLWKAVVLLEIIICVNYIIYTVFFYKINSPCWLILQVLKFWFLNCNQWSLVKPILIVSDVRHWSLWSWSLCTFVHENLAYYFIYVTPSNFVLDSCPWLGLSCAGITWVRWDSWDSKSWSFPRTYKSASHLEIQVRLLYKKKIKKWEVLFGFLLYSYLVICVALVLKCAILSI